MPRWSLLLGGPLIWAAHFGAIYAAASVSYVAAGATSVVARVVIIAITAVCLVACSCLLRSALNRARTDDLNAFWRTIAAAGAVLAMIAIVWQTLPTFAPIEGPPPLASR